MKASNLRVFRDAVALLAIIAKMAQHFPRVYRFTLGTDAIKAAEQVIVCIQMINLQKTNEERLIWFNEYIVYEEQIRTFIGIAADTKTPSRVEGKKSSESVSSKMYAEYMDLLSVVGKQMIGWQHHTEREIENARA